MDGAEPLLESSNGTKCAVAVGLISRGDRRNGRCRRWRWRRSPRRHGMRPRDLLSRKRRASRQLTMHVVERQAVFQFSLARGRDFLGEVCNGFLQIRIVLRKLQGHSIVLEGPGEISVLAVDVGSAANRGESVGCAFENLAEFLLGFVELVELDQRSTQRDSRREIAGMNREPRAAGLDRFCELPGATVLFCKLRKSNRRRIL